MKTFIRAFVFCLASIAGEKQPLKIEWNADAQTLSGVSTIDNKTKYVIDYKTRTMTANGERAERFEPAEQFMWIRNFTALTNYIIVSADWYVDPEADKQRIREKRQRRIRGSTLPLAMKKSPSRLR